MPALVSSLVRVVEGTRPATEVGRDGLCDLVEVLSVLPDPRRRQGLRFELETVLGLSLAAVIAGARSYRGIAEWVADLDEHVRRRFGGGRLAPSAATIRRVVLGVDPDLLDAVLTIWVSVRAPAGLRGHGVQPHPRRGHDHRTRPGQAHHRHDPPQVHRGPSPARHHRAPPAPTPTSALPLGRRMDRTLPPRLRAAGDHNDLTTSPHQLETDQQWNPRAARPAAPPRPTTNLMRRSRSRPAVPDHRWIQV